MRRKLTPGYDLVIAGSGVAGLYGALCAAAEGRVLVVSKGPVLTSSSWLAQGGVAAATAPDDAPELHAADTLLAGRGLSRERAVRALTLEAPARIVDLADLGVRFDGELGLEGGHSRRRVHSVGGAQTGRERYEVIAHLAWRSTGSARPTGCSRRTHRPRSSTGLPATSTRGCWRNTGRRSRS